jgi:D-hexose-6-phosphate mutarotase
MKEININMKSVEVKTTTRPIRADWTSEMAQDLSTYYGMDNISSIEISLLKEIIKEKRKNKINKIYKSQKHN